MLFFHKKNPPARPAGLNWYWTLTVDGMPAADFDWPDLLRGLDLSLIHISEPTRRS